MTINEVIEDSRKLLKDYDEAWKSQPDGVSNARLIVLANYGELALSRLRYIVEHLKL